MGAQLPHLEGFFLQSPYRGGVTPRRPTEQTWIDKRHLITSHVRGGVLFNSFFFHNPGYERKHTPTSIQITQETEGLGAGSSFCPQKVRCMLSTCAMVYSLANRSCCPHWRTHPYNDPGLGWQFLIDLSRRKTEAGGLQNPEPLLSDLSRCSGTYRRGLLPSHQEAGEGKGTRTFVSSIHISRT